MHGISLPEHTINDFHGEKSKAQNRAESIRYIL